VRWVCLGLGRQGIGTVGKWETCLWVSTFPPGLAAGAVGMWESRLFCGEIPKGLVERGGSLLLGRARENLVLPAPLFSVLHKRTSELFRELAVAHADGSIGRFLVRLSRIDILVLDDFAMAPLKDAERRDFLEICDDRYQRRSMILTSQMPVSNWHEQIGDPTIADSILDRLIHNAYRIELKGESMRKKRRKPGEEESQ